MKWHAARQLPAWLIFDVGQKKMKPLLTVAILILLAGCASAPRLKLDPDLDRTHISRYEVVQSPSRRYMALSGVGLADVSPSIRMRVRILLVHLDSVHVEQILPWVRSPFVVVWSPDDVLLVCGLTDDPDKSTPYYEISAFQLNTAGKLDFRAVTEQERDVVIAAFEAKHGSKPLPLLGGRSLKPNKAPEPTPGSVTPRATE